MNFVKYNRKNHIEIQPAALVLSNLENSPQMELHTLDHALVLLKDDMTEAEQLDSMTALIKLVNSMMADIISKRKEEDPAASVCIDDTEDGGIIVSVYGHEVFALSADMVSNLGVCGISPEMMVEMLLDLKVGEEDA